MSRLQNSNTLLAVGLLLEVAGAVLQLRIPTPAIWIMIVGGALISLSYLVGSGRTKVASVRVKRLDRMGFVSGLGYLIAGGFALDEQRGAWILIFVIATVLAVYSIFVKDKIEQKA